MRITNLKYIPYTYNSFNNCESRPLLNVSPCDTFQPQFKSNYVPKKTIHEAKDFAIRNFGLKRYEIADLEVANWLNKALLYVKDITNGKSTILENVVYKNYDDSNGKSKNVLAAFQCQMMQSAWSSKPHIRDNTLVINKTFVKNIDNHISTEINNLINLNMLTKTSKGLFLSSNYTTKYKNRFEHLMNKRFRDMTFEDKMGLYDFLHSLDDYSAFKMADINHYVNKFLANNKNKFPAVYSFPLKYGFSNAERFSVLNKTEQIAGVVHNINVDGKYKAVLHELGHMLHAHISPNVFAGMNPQFERYFRNNIYTASKISQYAKTSAAEFVAETFVKLALKMKLPKDVVNLYQDCGGYMV